ncbi:MAG: beta-lactamase family protein [Spirochaetales bacterium]|nr:beta-lactamase family protein [Spirochaetales bacterium]
MVRTNPEKVGFDGSKLSRLDKLFHGLVGGDSSRKEIPGMGLRIMRRGIIAFDNCYGFADQENLVPMTEDTVMRIFSMSKPIVSTAALTLYEQGAFTLDEPIKKYIPSFESPRVLKSLDGDSTDMVAAESDITIGQLFTMTSGLSYGFDPDNDKLDRIYSDYFEKLEKPYYEITTEDFIDRLAQFPLAFHPGSDYRYSWSIDVLGRLIEVLSGRSLGDYLESELFIPLGMSDTGFFANKEQLTRQAGLYDYSGEERVRTDGDIPPGTKPAFESGGGGLLSTMNDYTRFCEMLRNRGSFEGAEILSRKTIELMSSNHLEGKSFERFFNGNKKGYGYGLGVRTMLNPAKAGINGSIGEFGWDGAASTWMMVDPKEEVTALFMIQEFPFNYHGLHKKFLQMIYSALR